MFGKGLLIGKHPYQNEAMPEKNALFRAQVTNKFQRPSIIQLNIEGFTASKINVLHHLALQFEALVILLQETHGTNAKKLILSSFQLAGSSSLSRNMAMPHLFMSDYNIRF